MKAYQMGLGSAEWYHKQYLEKLEEQKKKFEEEIRYIKSMNESLLKENKDEISSLNRMLYVEKFEKKEA